MVFEFLKVGVIGFFTEGLCALLIGSSIQVNVQG